MSKHNIGVECIGDQIAVKKDAPRKMLHGVILPDRSADKGTCLGTVVAVGDGEEKWRPNIRLGRIEYYREPLGLELGTKIAFPRWAGVEEEVNGEMYLFLNQKDVLCVVAESLYSRKNGEPLQELHPPEDRVVLELLEEDKHIGDIILPDVARPKPVKGRVVAVGPGRKGTQGNLLPMSLCVGATVYFGHYAGYDVELGKDGDKKYKITRESDVLAVYEESP